MVTEVRTGDVELMPAYQWAKVRPTSPETPTAAGATWTQSAESHYRVSPTGSTYFWFRAGLLARVKSGGSETAGYFQAQMLVSKVQCGAIVGRREIEAYPRNSNSLADTSILTAWLPTVGVDKFRAAMVATAVSDLDYRFRCRTAVDITSPNAWEDMGSWSTLSNGNSEINTGSGGSDLSIPAEANLTSNSRIQFALATRMKSGGTDPGGLLRVIAGLRFS